MFGAPESLIIVYKDKMLANQIKKLIAQNNDNTTERFEVVTWTEKVWLAQDKTGTITSKVLFLGNIKGVDKLIPVIDKHYNEFGIHYGWAAGQAVIYVKPSEIKALDRYLEFYNALQESSVPQVVKDLIKPKNLTVDDETIGEETAVEPEVPNEDEKDAKTKFLDKSKSFMKTAKGTIKKSFDDFSKKAQDFSEENFKSKKDMEQQMLFYGVSKFCNDGLEMFMNS